MTRDELLSELAMMLAEWPNTEGWQSGPCYFISSSKYYGPGHPDRVVTTQGFTKNVWLNERARLINKPSWDDAPDWAQWLCQQKTGCWLWYASEPALELNKWKGAGMRSACGSTGDIPAGHDWRTTLEQRPETKPSAVTRVTKGGGGSGSHVGNSEHGVLTGYRTVTGPAHAYSHEQPRHKHYEQPPPPEWDGKTWPPPVGSRCMMKSPILGMWAGEWLEVEVVAHRDTVAVGWCDAKKIALWAGLHACCPIKSARQISIESLARAIQEHEDDGRSEAVAMAEAIYAAIQDGEVPGVKLGVGR